MKNEMEIKANETETKAICDCMKCGRTPKFETDEGADYTFEWKNFWFVCYHCDRQGMVSEKFEQAVWNWNQKNIEGGLYVEHKWE